MHEVMNLSIAMSEFLVLCCKAFMQATVTTTNYPELDDPYKFRGTAGAGSKLDGVLSAKLHDVVEKGLRIHSTSAMKPLTREESRADVVSHRRCNLALGWDE